MLAAQVVYPVFPPLSCLGFTGASLNPAQFQKNPTSVPLVEKFFSSETRRPRRPYCFGVKKCNSQSKLPLKSSWKASRKHYAPFTPSYTSIKIIVIEFGVIKPHPEIAGLFRHVRHTRKHYPKDHNDKERFRESTAEGHFRGTCIASIIGGSKNSVAQLMYRHSVLNSCENRHSYIFISCWTQRGLC